MRRHLPQAGKQASTQGREKHPSHWWVLRSQRLRQYGVGWGREPPFQNLVRDICSICLIPPRTCAEAALEKVLVPSAFLSQTHGSYWKPPTFPLSGSASDSGLLDIYPAHCGVRPPEFWNDTAACLWAWPFLPDLRFLSTRQHCAGQHLPGPGLLPGFLVVLRCSLSWEHGPELQPLWQGHWQHSWPSATILFLSATSQNPLSTRMDAPTHMTRPHHPFLLTTKCFHYPVCSFAPAVLH